MVPKLYNCLTEGEPKRFLDKARDPDSSNQWQGDFSSSFGRLAPSGLPAFLESALLNVKSECDKPFQTVDTFRPPALFSCCCCVSVSPEVGVLLCNDQARQLSPRRRDQSVLRSLDLAALL